MRLKPKPKKGSLVSTFVFVIFLGVAVGCGIVYKDQILAMINKPQQQPAQPAPQPPPAPVAKVDKAPDAAPPPIAKPTAPLEKPKVPEQPLQRIVTGADDEAAKAGIAQGVALLEKLEFERAASVFKSLSQRKLGSAMKAEVSTWEKKATAFELATRHIPISEFATAETTYLIETHDGREMQGIVKSETADMVTLQLIQNPVSVGRTTLPLPVSDIKKKTAISQKDRRDDFLQLLGGLESNTAISRSSDYYDLVYVSKRLGLGKECIEYLNRAYNGNESRQADPYIHDTFRKEVIRRSIDRCSLMLAAGRAKRFVEDELNRLIKTLPGYDVAQDEVESFRMKVLSKMRDDFKSTITLKDPKKSEVAVNKKAPPAQSAKQLATEGEQMEFVVESGGVTGSGAAGPIVEQANAKYEEGMKVYRNFRQGTNGNNNEILKTAMKHLEAAVDLYDQALKKDPSNKSVLDRQTEANMIVYACKKYATL
ncbi:MAG TPA: hypothetical protein VEK08_01415 [Planctomycetota bacterium]|nr:hypothetical protein [Planctomycetota bacterium]